jgi:hypothetical protein
MFLPRANWHVKWTLQKKCLEGAQVAAQSISPETSLNALFSKLICDTIKTNISLFVGWLKCSELEGVVGELQKNVVYRSCTL